MATLTTAAPSATSPALKRLLQRHPVTAFFVLTYVLTWVLWVPSILSRQGVGLLPFSLPIPGMLLILISGVTGPLLTAFIMASVMAGKAGRKQLLQRVARWRVGIWWYLLALVGIPVVRFLGLTLVLGKAPLQALLQSPALLAAYLPFTIVGLVITVLEETGWMGFAAPQLQAKAGPLAGAIVLGALWGIWHLPGFLVAGANVDHAVTDPLLLSRSLLILVLLGAAVRIVMLWIFNTTRGSVLIAMIFHSALDQTDSTLVRGALHSLPPITGWLHDVVLVGWLEILTFGTCAALVLLCTRGRLSSQLLSPSEREDKVLARE